MIMLKHNGIISFCSEKDGFQLILMLVLHVLLPVKLCCTFQTVAWKCAAYTAGISFGTMYIYIYKIKGELCLTFSYS